MAYKIINGKAYWEKWFENNKSATALKHKNAYNKSVKEQRCVKVRQGCYYYKGFEIRCAGTGFWNWKNPSAIDSEYANTKKECIETIDQLIKSEMLDLCDIVCV